MTDDSAEIIAPDDYELNNGRTLHVWICGMADAPELWACSVYDHGPFCRLCQRVDEVLSACLLNVLDGRMECDQDQDGQFRFKVTPAGIDAVVGDLMLAARRGAEQRTPQFGRTRDEMYALIALLDEIQAKELGPRNGD